MSPLLAFVPLLASQKGRLVRALLLSLATLVAGIALLDAVLLGSLVRSLPPGLDAIVGEAGATLSAGQSRRLSLARTLLSSARILVLDEPTGGLDRETELAVFRNLAAAAAGRTLILITHASPPEESVDRTYRLLDGDMFPIGETKS